MNRIDFLAVTACTALLITAARAVGQDGPLPKFTFQKVALHPDNLKYAPTNELIHPTLIKTEGRVENPLGKYYMYYAPHKHVAISMAYSDSMDGPWIEHKQNPVVEGPSAPDIRWMEDAKLFYMWGHTKNSRTELWTSKDGIHFEHHSVSVTAQNIGTRNASYSRVYEYPIEKYSSRYIMLYSGFIEGREIRCVWLAHSKDAITWTQVQEPLVEPIEGEMNDCYGPAFVRWKGKNYVTYQDHTTWRGGNMKYVEVDQDFTPVGAGGKRYVLLDPPAEPPLNDRYRGAEFYLEGDTLYMYSSASKNPRLIVFATAKVDPDAVGGPSHMNATKAESKTQTKVKPKKSEASSPVSTASESDAPMSLDDILKGVELETIYETTFDEPIKMIREDELLEDGKIVREPPRDVDWVLEGPAEVTVESGRLKIKNDPSGNCVLWNTREFPECFVAEWDFQHHHPQGLAIIFFAARGQDGGNIFTPGLTRRGGAFGKYTRGKIVSYHTSYTATDEQGNPRGAVHLKKNRGEKNAKKGNRATKGVSFIDGKTDKPYHLRLAKLGNRIILEIDGKISFDWTDDGSSGAPFTAGQIGFRQMRHALEASYGGFKVQRVKSHDPS